MGEDYRNFTKPAELHKAINTLRGMVAGIKFDETVNQTEFDELVHWCEIHGNLRDHHPFSEILPRIEVASENGTIDEEDAKDILWLCNNFSDNSSYYDIITSNIQFLSGLIHGIMADGELTDKEIQTLKSWVDASRFLAGTYPFDEIESLLYKILEDGVITTDEREELSAFLSNIVEFKDSYNLVEQDFVKLREKYNISGICARSPEITFESHSFCFTGESYRCTRKELVNIVEQLGGKFRASVSKKTDFLIVGSSGNPCWAYSCYGRKIEEAIALRKEGARIVIVNETDFWDAADVMLASIQ